MEIATMGERGQIVLPKRIRERLKLTKGEKLMVLEKEGLLVLKTIGLPSRTKFDRMLRQAREHARKHNLTEADAEDAIRRARSSTRTSS